MSSKMFRITDSSRARLVRLSLNRQRQLWVYLDHNGKIAVRLACYTGNGPVVLIARVMGNDIILESSNESEDNSEDNSEDSKVTCHNCYGAFDESETREYDGDIWCDDCFDENHFCCDHCEGMFNNEQANNVVITNHWRRANRVTGVVCDSCLESHFTRCDDCSDTFPNDSMAHVNGNDVCDDCLSNYSTCDSCGTMAHTDDCYSWTYEDGESYCEDCTPNQNVMSYSTDVLNILDGFKRSNLDTFSCDYLYMGIELEVQSTHSERIIDKLQVDEKYAILKEDCSIRGSGFEIVTIPATLNYHKETLKAVSNTLLNYTDGSNSSCGMHVHVSREELTMEAIANLLLFLGNEDNENLLVKIAGRDYRNNNYAGGKIDCYNKGNARNMIEDNNGCRYMPLNVSKPKTVEFRIFQSTNDSEVVMTRLEFLHSLCKYAMTHDEDSMTFEQYFAWLESMGETAKNYARVFEFFAIQMSFDPRQMSFDFAA